MRVIKEVGKAPVFEFDAGSPKEIFDKLALLDSVFTEKTCGCCNSEDIVYVVRPVDNGSYLELRCNKCRAQLSFGQNKDGRGIFVKRWDKDKKEAMPNRGWFIYQKSSQGDSYESPATGARSPSNQSPPMSGEDIPF